MHTPKNQNPSKQKKLIINPHCTIISESGSFEVVQYLDNFPHSIDEDIGLRLTPPISHDNHQFKFTSKKNSPMQKKCKPLPKIDENTSFFSGSFIAYAAIIGGTIGLFSALSFALFNGIIGLFPMFKIIFLSTICSAILSACSALIIKSILDNDSGCYNETPFCP